MSLLLSGLCVSKGVAIGKAYVMKQGQPDVPEYSIDESMVDSEVDRYTQAIKITRNKLQKISENITKEVSTDIADFIESHILTLDETAISRIPRSIIRKKKINAEWALKQQYDELVKVFDDIKDPYLQSRKDDIVQVVNIVLKILNQQDIKPIFDDDSHIGGRVIIADQLTPGDLAVLHSHNIVALVSEHDAPSSHTALMARSLGIPAITGVSNAHQYIDDGENVLIDGKYGSICIQPDHKSIEHYQSLADEIRAYKSNLRKLADVPTVTSDGEKITLYANVDLPHDLEKIKLVKPEGIGLYRTEFLYVNCETLPSEEEQYEEYIKICKHANGNPVTIRTLDIGADKSIPTVDYDYEYSNPMLGLRAIRMSLVHPEIFATQLRAILRASAHGRIRIIFPMVISVDELTQAKEHINIIKQNLTEENMEFDQNIEVGVMIETPAAALAISIFVHKVDFIAIGTNDLVQYLLAIDRTDELVSHLYDPCHPAVLNTINNIIRTCDKNSTSVYVCGDMASDAKYIRLLLGMGLKKFSAMPSQLLEVKSLIRNSSISNAKLFTNEILKSSKSKRIKELINKLNS